jgi:diaminopimelate decarboxylase
MPPDASLPGSSDLLAYRESGLELDGAAIAPLVERHGTPFFLFAERRLVDNYRALERGFAAAGAPAELRYCAKANHEAGVLSVLAREGSSLLASHLAELELALACGFPAGRIAYQRPAASAGELVAVLEAGVPVLHAFRPDEALAIAALADRTNRQLRLSLRLRPARPVSLSPLAGLNARLGVTAREAIEIARALEGSPRVRISALNVYIGTQQAGTRTFERELRRAAALARELSRIGAGPIEEINLGGGVPSPSLRRLALSGLWARWRDSAPRAEGGPRAVERFAVDLGSRFRGVVESAGLRPVPRLVLEPGRSVVGNAAVLVTRVVAVDGPWLFVDASRNFLGESPLLFRRPIRAVREGGAGGERFVHLSGNTLNTLDVLDYRRRLPRLVPGEALAIGDAGAYSISRASRYAGTSPPVLLVGRDGEVRVIRRAESFADLASPMAPVLSPAGQRTASESTGE